MAPLPIALPEIITITKQCGSFLVPTSNKHVDHIMEMIHLCQMYTFHKLQHYITEQKHLIRGPKQNLFFFFFKEQKSIEIWKKKKGGLICSLLLNYPRWV